MVQRLCAVILRSRGFEPIVEDNGTDGLETYRERHQEICLVLSDVSMPFMDGVEMARKMFEVSSRANVILMSGAHLGEIVPDDIRRLCSVIEKPFTPAQLVDAVRKCLNYDSEHHHAQAAN
jgi:DNA-binding NtrC family response regulator